MNVLSVRRAATVICLGLVATACGGNDSSRTADRFNEIISRDISVDYTPLVSPAQAIQLGDLVVAGDVVAVSDGMSITVPADPVRPRPLTEEEAALPEIDQPDFSDVAKTLVLGSYVTVEVRVTDVVSGDGAVAGDLLLVQVEIAPVTTVDELSLVAPLGPAVFVLADVTSWTPRAGAAFDLPDPVAEQGSIFIPYTDGMWFTTSIGAGNPYVEVAELGPAWGSPATVAQLVTRLSDAAV